MYHTLFVFLLLGGIGFPIPEEFPILLGGIGYAMGEASLEGVFLACYLGMLIGDQTIYLAGRLFGSRLLEAGARSPLLPLITFERLEAVRNGLRRRRLLYLLTCRHLFFLRPTTFIAAGALKIPYLEFLAADGLAALFSVGFFLYLGYLIAGRMPPEVVSALIKRANLFLLALLLVGLLVYLTVLLIKHCRSTNGLSVKQ